MARRTPVSVLCAALLAASGCGAASKTGHEQRPEHSARISAAGADVYAYCAVYLETGDRRWRGKALRALRRLRRDYNGTANTPFAGEGRDQVRLALLRAARQLYTCDAPLAAWARSVAQS